MLERTLKLQRKAAKKKLAQAEEAGDKAAATFFDNLQSGIKILMVRCHASTSAAFSNAMFHTERGARVVWCMGRVATHIALQLYGGLGTGKGCEKLDCARGCFELTIFSQWYLSRERPARRSHHRPRTQLDLHGEKNAGTTILVAARWHHRRL
jgi:hypothetical protein